MLALAEENLLANSLAERATTLVVDRSPAANRSAPPPGTAGRIALRDRRHRQPARFSSAGQGTLAKLCRWRRGRHMDAKALDQVGSHRRLGASAGRRSHLHPRRPSYRWALLSLLFERCFGAASPPLPPSAPRPEAAASRTSSCAASAALCARRSDPAVGQPLAARRARARRSSPEIEAVPRRRRRARLVRNRSGRRADHRAQPCNGSPPWPTSPATGLRGWFAPPHRARRGGRCRCGCLQGIIAADQRPGRLNTPAVGRRCCRRRSR